MGDSTQQGKSVVLHLLFLSVSDLLFSHSETHRSDAWVTRQQRSACRTFQRLHDNLGQGLIDWPIHGSAVYTLVGTGKVDASMPKINGSVSEIVSSGQDYLTYVN
jgi:hypothetical protein